MHYIVYRHFEPLLLHIVIPSQNYLKVFMKTRPIEKVFGLVFFTVLGTSFEHTTAVTQLPATVTVGIVVVVFISLPTHVLVFGLTTTTS